MKPGKKATITKAWATWDGTNGNDTVTIKAKEYVTVNTKKGNDKIYLKKGNWHQINAGAGDDVITVTKGNNHSIDVGSGKKDKVTVNGGNSHVIGNFTTGATGNVTIIINSGKHHAINAGALGKNVKVYLNGGHTDSIITWEGNDTVVVSGKGSMSNKAWQYVNPARKCAIDTGSGKDSVTFEAKNGKGFIAYTGAGNDTITIKNGKKHQVHTDAGNDKVKITGGTGHIVYLDTGKNGVTMENTKATVYTKEDAVDNITIKWNQNKTNNYTIKTPEIISTSYYGITDSLTVKGIKSSAVTFADKNGTLIMSAAGGSISIDHFDESWKWNNGMFGTTNFGNGIKFDDGLLSLDAIRNRVSGI